MNIIVVCKKRIADFLHERAHNALGRQRIIVYMLHVVLIVGSVLIQFLNMGGSQKRILMWCVHISVVSSMCHQT
jgi:hypothetical protein